MLNKNNKLKKIMSFTLVMAMLICSLFTMSAGATSNGAVVDNALSEYFSMTADAIVLDYEEESYTALDGSVVTNMTTVYNNGFITRGTLIVEYLIESTTNSIINPAAYSAAGTSVSATYNEIMEGMETFGVTVEIASFTAKGTFEYSSSEVKSTSSSLTINSKRSGWTVTKGTTTFNSGSGFLWQFPWAEIKFHINAIYGSGQVKGEWDRYPTLHCNENGTVSYKLN